MRYKALGGAIPPYIEVNVRHMELETDLLVRDLPIPPGTKIYEKVCRGVRVVLNCQGRQLSNGASCCLLPCKRRHRLAVMPHAACCLA